MRLDDLVRLDASVQPQALAEIQVRAEAFSNLIQLIR
jgi:hypothetical protein